MHPPAILVYGSSARSRSSGVLGAVWFLVVGLVGFFFFNTRASVVLLKIRLISSFSTAVTLSNVIRLVCQDFINP